ncbi:hypothetical protein CYFUS_002895 [Cystobacter fuscus]|uniref:Lipoprotein n=1 Tax=Cystobacter fuscus TaxID=43 RepID=A0A250J1N5_9BACT|nr:hypothetical protein CYFUS_002895 [Cystobacter fuscus]
MIRRPLMSLLLLLALCTACPETWRKGSRIDRALAKDVEAAWRGRQRPPYCIFSQNEWVKECSDDEDWDKPDACHPECGP